MLPVLQRTYSKAKANANGVVWTSQEAIPVSVNADGLISSGVYGLFTVTGRPMYCSAFQVHFTVPAQDPGMYLQISLLDKNSMLVPGSILRLYGCSSGILQPVAPAFFLNVGDTLRFNICVINGETAYLPQDASLVYFMNYANGLLGQQPFNYGTTAQSSNPADNMFYGNYAGNAPSITPTVGYAIAFDTSNRRQWQWANGIWT